MKGKGEKKWRREEGGEGKGRRRETEIEGERRQKSRRKTKMSAHLTSDYSASNELT